MKKDSNVLLFSLIYLLMFTLIYVFVYYDYNAFLFLFLIVTIYSFPGLISVLILLLIERQYKLKIHSILYVTLSIIAFYISFLVWNRDGHDSRNFYPSLTPKIHIAVYYSTLSHLITYGSFQLFNYLKKKSNAT